MEERNRRCFQNISTHKVQLVKEIHEMVRMKMESIQPDTEDMKNKGEILQN